MLEFFIKRLGIQMCLPSQAHSERLYMQYFSTDILYSTSTFLHMVKCSMILLVSYDFYFYPIYSRGKLYVVDAHLVGLKCIFWLLLNSSNNMSICCIKWDVDFAFLGSAPRVAYVSMAAATVLLSICLASFSLFVKKSCH